MKTSPNVSKNGHVTAHNRSKSSSNVWCTSKSCSQL